MFLIAIVRCLSAIMAEKNLCMIRQKYAEITEDYLGVGIEINDKRLRFLQTKHLQCSVKISLVNDKISQTDESSYTYNFTISNKVCKKS